MNLRHDWTMEEIEAIYDRPLLDLIFDASKIHRENFDSQKVQVSSLISIKTGGCPEDCSYCPQAARYQTGINSEGLMKTETVMNLAQKAKDQGASRVCLGAAWREVKDNKQFDQVLDMVKGITGMGVEVCCTLGMLSESQANKLKEAGLYAYNHNIDTSEDYYKSIISTRSYEDRLKTLKNVQKAKISVCSGGIIGMGETKEDRLGMLKTLSNLAIHPDSVPINTLVAVEGTPLEKQKEIPIWDLLRMIATARIIMPHSMVRLSAGRNSRSFQDQALCFLAGANSIFSGEKLLTTPNPEFNEDKELFELLGLKETPAFESHQKQENYQTLRH
ncbi:MAG: biotin synthase BioB [Bdellovibrionota bacterium]|nr:biotin synthase BioB [Bdellovibrionota bacterium]